MRTFDNLIIGAGPGGYELAAGLAARGESVAVFERDLEGGTCLNRGCIPTKCLCASARRMIEVADAPKFGIETCGCAPRVDYSAVHARMTSVVGGLRDGVRGLLRDVETVHGEAMLEGYRIVRCNGELWQATKRLVIATGSRPAIPPVEGAELLSTSDDVLAMTQLPESMVIIGAGVIGIEFASAFSTFGVKVTVVEFCKEILPPFDPEIAKRLRMALTRRGVTFMLSSKVVSVEAAAGRRKLRVETQRGVVEVDADMAVSAVGRRPVLPAGLEKAGIALDSRGFIAVDENMSTSAEGTYAVGDVNGLSLLAHSASAQARVILTGNPRCFDASQVPGVVYSIPELASVGPLPQTLEQDGVEYRAVKRQYASLGKARADGSDGVAKFLVSAADGRLLAATILGDHAGDLIMEAEILIADGRSLADAASLYIHPHPSMSEIFI